MPQQRALSARIREHQAELSRCTACPDMIGPVVMGQPAVSGVMLIGQAPGIKEGGFGRPFAWTAGKTLFKWFESIGLPEQSFRERVYMSAVCRCFPGKHPKGGDRVPNPDEIANCAGWLRRELNLLKPQLIIPVGKLAIRQMMAVDKLDEVVGSSIRWQRNGFAADVIALPHPSGASTWHRSEPGKTLLQSALSLIGAHPAWAALRETEPPCQASDS